jgi:hypothetical protein
VSVRSEAAPAQAAEGATGVSVYRGLLWREWLAHRNLIINALAVWLVCGWVLLIFFHPGFIIPFGVLYALVAGTLFGGGDAAEGSEEFSFALPPTRRERYLARMIFGGATVLGFAALGDVAIALDLPQQLWALFVNSGFSGPFRRCEPRFLHALAIALPFATFAFTFAMTANAATRIQIGWTVLGLLLALAVMGLGFLGERFLWEELNGYVSVTALVALAPLGLLVGYLAYQRKEGISRPAPLAARSRWGPWLAALIVVGAVLGALFVWLLADSPAPEATPASMPVVTDPPALPPRRPINARPAKESPKGQSSPHGGE